MIKKEVHERLQEAMDIRGMRAVDLVEKTGIPKGTLSYYLSGKTKPKQDRLYTIAQVLDVSEAWLLGYDVPMQRTADQKKNDQLVKLVVRMRSDSEFTKAVSMLDSLSPDQFSAILGMLSAMNQ